MVIFQDGGVKSVVLQRSILVSILSSVFENGSKRWNLQVKIWYYILSDSWISYQWQEKWGESYKFCMDAEKKTKTKLEKTSGIIGRVLCRCHNFLSI